MDSLTQTIQPGLEGGQVLSGLTFLVLVPTSLLRGLHDMEKSLLL